MPITGSFWLYTQEAEVWRLHVVTPLVATEGPRKVYDKLLNILDADQEHEYVIPAICLYAADDNNPYVSLLHKMRLSDELFDRRLTGVGVNGSGYIEDAYIYRLYENDEVSHSQADVYEEDGISVGRRLI
ncbi:MAG: hypothetical protein KAI83_02940 [Thiomargarita sp.]|nr:hypothetical protein [Thiomargarita sp.]